MGNPQLGRDDVARDAVGLAEVGIARRDDTPTQGTILGIIEELDDLLRNRTLNIAAPVGRHDQHVLLAHAQRLILGAQRDPRSREAKLSTKRRVLPVADEK